MVQSWRRALQPLRANLSTAAALPPLRYSDDYLREILRSVKTIAVVGASTDWRRPSSFAMKYLQHKGYRCVPINPLNSIQIAHGVDRKLDRSELKITSRYVTENSFMR